MKMSYGLFIALFIITYTLFSSVVFAQSFGKNKIQYQNFDWKYVQSRYFDVYYYEDDKRLAEFVAEVAESSYVALKKDFLFEINKRIPIIVYNSHNDFGQTNVIYDLIDEGVGGFTEIFKDRVVIPFQGNYEEFRHVIHHEITHAVMFQMLYGESVGSMVTGMARFQVPLWLAEGLAEYESLHWDTESDMFIRDATINGYIPPINQLSGFLVYKGGQSLLCYIADKYGEKKIGEVISKIKASRNVENALKQSIGIGMEELTERWHKYLRQNYWPDIENRNEPEDIAKPLTDHIKYKHFLNNSPALSPQGDKLVYLSNRGDYMDIYMMSSIDGRDLGRLVKGERSDLFEELHWPRPGIDWSPDGKQIVFAAKSGSVDALYIMDVDDAKIIDYYQFSLDGIFSPTWSPDGKQIVFMGLNKGQSDLYLYHIEGKELQQLTDDIFSDLDPKWSPTGDEIVFVSDRGEYMKQPDWDLHMHSHNYSQYDLYTLHISTREMIRYTADRIKEKSPVFSPKGDYIAFISDLNGIDNIFILNRSTQAVYPITNLLGGVSQISWSREGSRLAFSSFYNGGYDIFLLNNPIEIKPSSVELQRTAFLEKKEQEEEIAKTVKKEVDIPSWERRTNFDNFVFDEGFRQGDLGNRQSTKETVLDTTQYKDANGEYKSHQYKPRFTTDIITGSAGYSQFYGLQGTSMIAFSDILGNHEIDIYTDLFYNIKNSNIEVAYFYLPKRIDYGISAFHYAYQYYTYYTIGPFLYYNYIRDRYFGLSLFMSRPFDRYRRLDFGIVGLGIDRDFGDIDPYGYYYGEDYLRELGNLYKRRLVLLNTGYSTDTVVWGVTGPVNGGRSYFSLSYSPLISNKYGLDFWTLQGDWRKYLRVKRDYTFAVRLSGGVSGGKNPQRFLLGGMPGWINYKYNEISYDSWSDDLYYFSNFATPLRGYNYYEQIGTRFVLANLEFRFPLIQYLILGWPLPFGFENIRGVVFMDIGSAWDDDALWRPFAAGSLGIFKLHDLVAGYGFGARLNMGFILLKYDLAWSTDLARTYDHPVHYFTLGAEF